MKDILLTGYLTIFSTGYLNEMRKTVNEHSNKMKTNISFAMACQKFDLFTDVVPEQARALLLLALFRPEMVSSMGHLLALVSKLIEV